MLPKGHSGKGEPTAGLAQQAVLLESEWLDSATAVHLNWYVCTYVRICNTAIKRICVAYV